MIVHSLGASTKYTHQPTKSTTGTTSPFIHRNRTRCLIRRPLSRRDHPTVLGYRPTVTLYRSSALEALRVRRCCHRSCRPVDCARNGASLRPSIENTRGLRSWHADSSCACVTTHYTSSPPKSGLSPVHQNDATDPLAITTSRMRSRHRSPYCRPYKWPWNVGTSDQDSAMSRLVLPRTAASHDQPFTEATVRLLDTLSPTALAQADSQVVDLERLADAEAVEPAAREDAIAKTARAIVSCLFLVERPPCRQPVAGCRHRRLWVEGSRGRAGRSRRGRLEQVAAT